MEPTSSKREAMQLARSKTHGATHAAWLGRIHGWLAASLLASCTNAPIAEPAADELPAPDDHNGAVDPERADDAGGLPSDSRCAGGCDPRDAGFMPVVNSVLAQDAGRVAQGDPAGQGGRAESADAGSAATTGDSSIGQKGRPAGVADCFTAESSSHPATLRFREAFRSSDFAARVGAIGELAAAAAADPEAEEFALLLGLANLWRLTEPYDLEDLLALPETADRTKAELERAYALCPTDHRIPGWLGPTDIIMGRLYGDAALIDEGVAILNKGIEHYPNFVLFSNLLSFGDLPADDPAFLTAVESMRTLFNVEEAPCNMARLEPACINTPLAPYNMEAGALYVGDLYAKAQDRAAALAMYSFAKTVPAWANPAWESWKYQDLIEERIRTLDARIAAAASPRTLDDFEVVWNSSIRCTVCHRDR